MSIKDILEEQNEDLESIKQRLNESAFTRVQDDATIAPVTQHRLDPVTSIEDVSHMAGFRGHDTEVAEMVLGRRDAMAELRAGKSPSSPEHPLSVDATLTGVGLELQYDDQDIISEEDQDWCAFL